MSDNAFSLINSARVISLPSDNVFRCLKSVCKTSYSLSDKGWKLEETYPTKREIDAYVFLNSGASDGFKGTVKYAGRNRVWDMYVWDRYMIVDEHNKILSYVTIRDGDEGIPQMLFQGESDIPHFIVGETERRFFEGAEGNKVVLEGYAQTKYSDDTHCVNVVSNVGPKDSRIVICGHYDTVYATKGAYDNSSGAAIVIELARQLKNRHLNCGVEYLVTDGEEFNLAGSRRHVQENGVDGIKMVLNIDGVGRQKVLEVWTGPETLERKIRAILDKSKEEFEPIYICPPPPGSDHAPYHDMGIPSCMLTFNDQGILHSPKDDYRESLLENMEVMVRLSLDLLEQLKVIN